MRQESSQLIRTQSLIYQPVPHSFLHSLHSSLIEGRKDRMKGWEDTRFFIIVLFTYCFLLYWCRSAPVKEPCIPHSLTHSLLFPHLTVRERSEREWMSERRERYELLPVTLSPHLILPLRGTWDETVSDRVTASRSVRASLLSRDAYWQWLFLLYLLGVREPGQGRRPERSLLTLVPCPGSTFGLTSRNEGWV